MSKFDIWPKYECQNRISILRTRYSVSVRMSKWDFDCQNTIFDLYLNVKIGFQNTMFGISLNVKIIFRVSK